MPYVIVCDELLLCVCNNLLTAKNKLGFIKRSRLEFLRQKYPSRKIKVKSSNVNEVYKIKIYMSFLFYKRVDSVYKIIEISQVD